MHDLHIRITDPTYRELKQQSQKSNKTITRYIKHLLYKQGATTPEFAAQELEKQLSQLES